MKKKALVVGSGFGGISSALRLKRLGFHVTILERLDQIGGRARVFEVNGFKHDAGPTVITAPFLFDELFELFNEKREDHIEFRPLEPWYRFHFYDGQTFDYSESIKKTKKEMEIFKIIKKHLKTLPFFVLPASVLHNKICFLIFLCFLKEIC